MSPPSSNKRRSAESADETETVEEAPKASAKPAAPDLRGVKVIENHGYADVWLPPAGEFKKPIRLIPGFNNVPRKYLHALESKRVKNATEGGEDAVPYRYPGRATLERLQTPVRISHLIDGDIISPRITIYEPDQLGPKGIEADSETGVEVEGPPPPVSLVAANYNVDTARRVVGICKDVKALQRWLNERGLGKEVQDEIRKRIATLGG